jgi:hypothetical protein
MPDGRSPIAAGTINPLTLPECIVTNPVAGSLLIKQTLSRSSFKFIF